ncbi:hypothetical protein D5086_003987 [Populus alba]|uniref:Uncharacterized protein n=1 Tax=Populus alba TaxID=43335 RepID=A0ACC4D635_POPAL
MGMFLLSDSCNARDSMRLSGFSKISDSSFASSLHSWPMLCLVMSDLAFHDLIKAPCTLVEIDHTMNRYLTKTWPMVGFDPWLLSSTNCPIAMFLLSESCKSLESVRLANFAFYYLTKFQAFRCSVAEPNADCMARLNEKRDHRMKNELISVQLTVIGLDLDLSFGAVTDNLR